MVRVGPSNLLRGESGLFASETIIEGTVVACFGAMRELRKGEVGTGTRIGYSFIVRETGGRTLQITPRQGITEKCLAHAINHTVTLILRIASLYTRESQGIRSSE